jgi:predicted HTH transcriptional regulator
MIDDANPVGINGATIATTQNVKLDLNGKTITLNIDQAKTSQLIDNYGTLTIVDSSEEQTGKLTNAAAEGLSVGNWPEVNFATNIIKNSGTLNVEGGTIQNTANGSICYAIDNNNTSYDAIINFCQKHMFLAGTMETGQRIDTLTVPFLAIRETVLNMLAHRSWWDEDESLSVAIFDDRIEFTNPGHFPIGTSVEDFIETPRSKPQNPDIANVLFRSGWMESWGRGIANIMEACEQAGLPRPEFIKAPWITRIIFRFKTPLTPYLSGNPSNIPSIEGLNEGINEGLNGLNEGIKETYRIVRSHPGINAPQIAVLAGKSLATIERHLSALRKKGLIGHQDSKKTGGYYVK